MSEVAREVGRPGAHHRRAARHRFECREPERFRLGREQEEITRLEQADDRLEPPEDSRDQWEILAELAGRVNGASAEAVDELVFSRLLKGAVGPGTGCPEISPEAAREALGSTPGPERIVDLMLRAGPYGDRFEPGNAGRPVAIS